MHTYTLLDEKRKYNRLADGADTKTIKGIMAHLRKMSAAQWVSVAYYTFHD